MDQSDQSDISPFQRTTSSSSANSYKPTARRRRHPPRGNSADSVSSSDESAERNSHNGYDIVDQEATTVEPVQRTNSGPQSKIILGEDSFQPQEYLRIFHPGSDRTHSMSLSDSQSSSPLSSGLVSSMELSPGVSDSESGLPSHSDEHSTLTEHTTSGLDSIPTPVDSQSGFPPRPTDLPSREQVSAAVMTVDAVREQNRYGIQQMKGRGTMLRQEQPAGCVRKEDAIGAPIIDGIDLDAGMSFLQISYDHAYMFDINYDSEQIVSHRILRIFINDESTVHGMCP